MHPTPTPQVLPQTNEVTAEQIAFPIDTTQQAPQNYQSKGEH